MTKADKEPQLRSQQIFSSASEEVQNLIRAILKDERDVMHLKKRPKIQQKVLDHVKRVVK